MLKRMMSGWVVLAMLITSACGEMGNHARTTAVYDGMRALGLAQMPDGTYEFRLCEMAERYTPEVLAEKCINPLVAHDSSPLVLSEIPARPGTLVAQVWNWSTTLFIAAAAGLSVYGIGRYVVKNNAIKELSREAYAAGLRESLRVSLKYPHFELPQHLQKRLLKEVDDLSVDGETLLETPFKLQGEKSFLLKDTIKLKSGKKIELRQLLENKKLQRKKGRLRNRGGLEEDEAREVSELLVELEESLRSGSAYADTLTEGLDKMNAEGISLVDGVLGKIVHEHEGKLALDDKIKESLRKNRLLGEEYHEALQRLDTQVATVLAREANSISSRKRNIARLEAAAGLDEVLKIVEGVGDKAVVVAQKGDTRLLALTENNLRDMVEDFDELVEDGTKGADEIKEKLASMREQIEASVAEWEKQAEELADTTIDAEVVKGMENFIKTTRKKTLKGWSKGAKEAKNELQDNFKTPTYKTGAEAYEGQARTAVNLGDSVHISIEVKQAGKELVESVEATLTKTLQGAGLMHEPSLDKKIFDAIDLLNHELNDVVLSVNSFGDLKKSALTTVNDSSLFTSSTIDDHITDGAELAALRDKITENIKAIIDEAQQKADSDKVGFFKGITTRLRNFNFKKIFHYWDKNASSKLPSYKNQDDKLAVRVTGRSYSVGVKAAGEEIIESVDNIFTKTLADLKRKLSLDEDELVDGNSLLKNELKDVARSVNNLGDLKELTLKKVEQSSLFKSSSPDDHAARELVDMRTEMIDEIGRIIDEAHGKAGVKVTHREEVVKRLANNEEVGEVIVEKGVEKLLGHLAGAATFFAIPVTTLHHKLSGHARVSVANRWGSLTGSYELSIEGRVDDMHTIIEGIAEVTGAQVSDEVFYFMLRSGLRNKQ